MVEGKIGEVFWAMVGTLVFVLSDGEPQEVSEQRGDVAQFTESLWPLCK